MKKRFGYPGVFTTLPEYTAHAGQTVEVVRQLTNDECDPECQPMYLIRAADGWEGHAFDDELEDMQPMNGRARADRPAWLVVALIVGLIAGLVYFWADRWHRVSIWQAAEDDCHPYHGAYELAAVEPAISGDQRDGVWCVYRGF